MMRQRLCTTKKLVIAETMAFSLLLLMHNLAFWYIEKMALINRVTAID
jgi:hypothetical protein